MNGRHLDLVLFWHMHQPDYRDHVTGEFVLPWVYLHAIKDYCDMADHLERHPAIRAVVNFVPVLLDQIEDYAAQFDRGEFRDPLLRMLANPQLEKLDPADRRFLLDTCFRANHKTMLEPFPHYRRLHEIYGFVTRDGEAGLSYLSPQYFADLVTWYHLAWSGETERRREPLLTELMSRGENYGIEERRRLLAWIGRTVRNIIPRYRALAAAGRIELSCTPDTHPLGPLLLDFSVARESQPEAALPVAAAYPGGRTRLDAHVSKGRAAHARRFGKPPVGMWPAEGAVSDAFVRQVAAHECHWLASGEGVLRGSLAAARMDDHRAAYRPWRLAGCDRPVLFFRDERLSDLIGFDYAKWHGRDAAAHLVGELNGILAGTPPGETPIVSIIMDGENAWEHYPYNGYFFFEDFYGLIEEQAVIATTTFAEILSRMTTPPPNVLPRIQAGSWVFGTLSTWIGDPDKNRAWDLLCAAKLAYDTVMASGRLDEARRGAAEAQLAVCESSDWFWWFGDYNSAEAVSSFDRLFRRNLANLYRLLDLPAPVQLATSISRGTLAANGLSGTMRRATEGF